MAILGRDKQRPGAVVELRVNDRVPRDQHARDGRVPVLRRNEERRCPVVQSPINLNGTSV
jgi:hypothetical protein